MTELRRFLKMRASNEAAKKAANGTHIAIRIDNLQFDEGSSETSRLDLMVKGLSGMHRFCIAEIGHPRWAYAGPGKANPLQCDRYRGAVGNDSAPATRNPRRLTRGHHPVP